jgi:hypothetical protein
MMNLLVDLDPCEGQWLIEDHKQSTLGKDDFGNDTDNGNDTLSAFVIVPNVHSNYCHDQTTVLNSYFDQAAIIQSSLLDHQEMEVFESQSSEILYNHPIYDEYPDDEEEHISFPTCMETYNSSPLFDNYDECNLEVDEQQIISLSSESSLQQENYQLHYKSNQPVYDSDEEDSWTGDEGDKEGLLEQLISPSYLATDEQQTSEPQYDILEPEKEKISSGESVQRISCSLASRKRYRLILKILYLFMIQWLFGWSIFFKRSKMLQHFVCNQTSAVSASYLFILCCKKIIIFHSFIQHKTRYVKQSTICMAPLEIPYYLINGISPD